MVILPLFRSLARYASGYRPHPEDLHHLLLYFRRRRELGLPVMALPFPGLWHRPMRTSTAVDPMRWIRGLQARKLRNTVEYVYRYLPFYQRALSERHVKPADIRTLDDVHKLPITRRADIQEQRDGLTSRYPGMVATVPILSNGTTGANTMLFMSASEFEYITTMTAIGGLVSGQMGPQDILQCHFPLDTSPSGLVHSTAAHKAGTLVLTYGHTGTLQEHVESLLRERDIPGKKPQVSALFASPSHLWGLLHTAKEMGVDLSQCRLERISTGGAMVSEDLKRHVQASWGVRLMEGYSMTEIPACVAAECTARRHLHFLDYTGYAEVLDPQTEEPAPPGQPGILVVTSFYPDREITPLLRYWTNDLVIMSPETSCPCGISSTQLVDILGRADQVITVGACNCYPQQVGDRLLAYPELILPPRFRLYNEERNEQSYAVLDIELATPLADGQREDLRQRITQDVFGGYDEAGPGVVQFSVNLHPAHSLKRLSPYKHQGLDPEQWGRPRDEAPRGMF